DCSRQSMPQAAAGTRVERVGLENGQMIVHRAAAARRLFDDDAASRAKRGDLLHQITIGEAISLQARRSRRKLRGYASRRWGAREQRMDTELEMRHDRHTCRRPCRDGRVVRELYQLRARRHMR